MRKKAKPDAHIREFLKQIYQVSVPDAKAMRECSKSTGLNFVTVEQAVRNGKGSVDTHGKIIGWIFAIDYQKPEQYITKFRKLTKSSDKVMHLEKLLGRILKKFNIDQLILVLELMDLKDSVESKLGILKKPGRPAKSR